MVKYNCKYCKYTTQRRSNYNKHIQTTKHKLNIELYKNANKTYKCEYCNGTFKTQRCLHNHHLKSCTKIPNDIKNKLITKHNNNPKTKPENKIELIPLIVNGSNNGCSKNNSDGKNKLIKLEQINFNNINLDNVHTIGNYKYLKILEASNEDISHITYDDKVKIFNSGLNFYTIYQNLLYNNPSNLNVAIVNKRIEMLSYIEIDTYEIYIDVKDYVISMIIDSNIIKIKQMYEEVVNELSEEVKTVFTKEINKFDNDNKSFIRRLKHLTYFKLNDYYKLCKNIFDNFVSIDNIDCKNYILIDN
jgi:hypothetical protein